jgi:glycogen debranching enzyme
MSPVPDAPAPGGPYGTLVPAIAADLPKLVLKHGDSFFVADLRGDFPDLLGSEFGFYVEGTRFLRRLELRVHGQAPLVLNSAVSEDSLQVAVDLTNPDVAETAGIDLRGRTIRLARRLLLYGGQLYQTLSVESFADHAHELSLCWHYSADFADVFEVRGFRREMRGTALPPERDRGSVRLSYLGRDGVVRTTHLLFNPAPETLDAAAAWYRILVAPGGRVELSLTVSAITGAGAIPAALGLGEAMARRRTVHARLADRASQIRTDHEYMNQWLDRARGDLHMLLTDTPKGLIAYAGIPWYVAPFGRDSLITALQVLPFEPEIAAGTLRFLAEHQASRDDAFTDQEPGKILHEFRKGELAACREIPFLPYYGSVDATPLFVILLAEYLRWTGDLGLVRELWPSVERALGWMLGPGRGRDGYLRYRCRSPRGLANQGWKDSHDAVMHADGSLARPPIALVEAQGYQYGALLGAAELAEAVGHPERAAPLREEARRLRERFGHDFWMEEDAFFALALDGEGQPCRVITSNPGHCLWAGIASDHHAAEVAKRLMADDLYSGWGLRTLSTRERRYNPMSYHNGSVWPHDTGLAAMGLRRYGFLDAFLTLATALFDAVLHCERLRMPELFCGFARLPGYGPTRYPVACSPQAWAAGVVFHLVQGMLGFIADALANRLTLVQPVLPPWLKWVEIHGLRVGASSIDLLVSRGRHAVAVELLARRGDAELIVER